MDNSATFCITEDDSATASRSKLYEIETRNEDFQETKMKTRESFRLDQQIVNRKFQQYLLRTESMKAVSDQKNDAGKISGPKLYTSSSSSGQPQSNSQHQESGKGFSNGHLSGNDRSSDSGNKKQVQKSQIMDSRPAQEGLYEKSTRGSNEHIYEKSNFNHPAKSRFGGSRTSMKSVDSELSTVSAGEVLYIPKDGSLRAFSAEQMTTIFRMLHVAESTVKRLRMKNINGKKFANFTDNDLEQMGIKNPVVCYFRDRSKKSGCKTPIFMM
ncbi:hypothetical protein CHS0354_027632 [Potamilus streckersoni]|uniref:Uncharacterized protein n=1 Tax=Potamilus streckersoni TaxID=2493646 RepID=A0AAE0W4R8_9BIVA|nr:hypothetical protein CHS0354_027632 [Potamilus streckersoni]